MNLERNQTLLNTALMAVAQATEAPSRLILGRSRVQEIALARMMVYVLLRERQMTQACIAALMNRTHAAVLVGARRMRGLITQHELLAVQLESARSFLDRHAPKLIAERLTSAPVCRGIEAIERLRTNADELRLLSKRINKHLKNLAEPQA